MCIRDRNRVNKRSRTAVCCGDGRRLRDDTSIATLPAGQTESNSADASAEAKRVAGLGTIVEPRRWRVDCDVLSRSSESLSDKDDGNAKVRQMVQSKIGRPQFHRFLILSGRLCLML